MESSDEGRWKQLAETQWSKPSAKARKVRPEVVKTEIWDVLEKEGFAFRSLLILDNLQLLEKYLWPGYDEGLSNHQVLLIALMVVVKRREGLPVWNIFTSNAESFSSLFRRILFMSVDDSLPVIIQNHLMAFIISSFQSLDSGIVRKECAPLVSISIWHHLASVQARETKLEEHTALRKAWRASSKRYEAADNITKARLEFERSWLYTLILKFVRQLYASENSSDTLRYCERFIELLTDLESQLPTRRYVNTLIQDLNLLSLIKFSPLYNKEDNGFLRDLYNLLRHFVNFSINDHTGAQYSRDESNDQHCARLARLQRASLKHFKSKLTILALSNYGAIEQRAELENHLSQLTAPELVELCSVLGYRTNYPTSTNLTIGKGLLLEILISAHERQKTFQEVIRDLNILPTEADVYDPSLLRNESYDGSRSLAIPKLNLQYLTVGDFLWRSFILHRCESFFEIRKDLEETIKRLQPRSAGAGSIVHFDGFSKMALPIPKPAIMEVAPPKVGNDEPAYVRAEITLDTSRLADHVRKEWDSLQNSDVIYLLEVRPHDETSAILNGLTPRDAARQSGLTCLRTATVVQVLDENGRAMRDRFMAQTNGHSYRTGNRRLVVSLDALAYKVDEDRKAKGRPDVYESINMVVRRKGRENNFKRILESIKSLTLSAVPVPDWFQEVFLGYGNPAGASYTQLENRLESLDFRDTFVDWQHLTESLPGRTVEPEPTADDHFGPPFVLKILPATQEPQAKPSKKRRRDDQERSQPTEAVVRVSTYQPPNNGPFVADLPRINKTRFTPAQVDAIISGTQPGLTVIVGPPGTGKTDVATQIISNIYHDFPTQRTLMIAHSNQALNQLFQKITNLDIDNRHLLRLGHGEEDLETDVNYGKHGRVESFLDNRARFLVEVDKLAITLGAPGAHGNSCETAGYFKAVYITPAWSKYWDTVNSDASGIDEALSLFPFYHYFQDAPQPLFPPEASIEQILDIANGCEHHIEKIFTELEDIRPFEILRNPKDKANYLLIKEARIIAMTSTHAAMRRQEIADLGFHYDNVVMEEAAQITEIENFIPLALQNPRNGKLPLQRIVLCGDHLQNSPIVQNLAFRQYANLEQSLFLRLVRLGVPVINLDQQGRARSSIAELYKWRYAHLGDLPSVLNGVEFQLANAGFRYDYQFIDVSDYKGAGEMQPSPHFIQNLGEAEYAVAIYQFMRLLGYPASKISILTTYAGQRALIRDVLGHRCARNNLFGLPRIVTTVDKYQGEQNDYVILSLTRTNRVGYLRDVRRLTVALSRARLGLYILGRREIFESCYELKEAFDRLLQRPDRLMLVTGELYPASRALTDEVEATEMTGVEHLGQYVYEMTQAKLKQLNGRPVITQALPDIVEGDGGEQGLIGGDDEEDDDDPAAHPEDLEDAIGVQ
ncbi:hypothetical protein MMC26_000563 [Xylographa opegraphella]|nr:hypothetical protein [Xylographa opegraphella]